MGDVWRYGARRVRSSLLVVVLATLPAFAVDRRGAATVWVGPGVDSNARRDFVTTGVPTLADGFLYALGQLEGALGFSRVSLWGSYDVGSRVFALLPSENTVVQSAQAEARWFASDVLTLGLGMRARDRRGADRDYTDLVGDVLLEYQPDASVDVRVRVGAHRFLYWPRFAYSHSGPDGTLLARYRFTKRHSASLLAGLNLRTYNANATTRPDEESPQPRVRADTVATAGASYTYRGPFHLTAGYSYFDQTSNSYGETLRRHRVSITAGVQLPWKLTALASGVLQLSMFPDGVYLSPELQVVEDDENSSALTLKLVRPVAAHVDLDLRYAVYVNVLPQNAFFYARHVVSVGASVSY